MEHSIFSRIINGEIPCYKIFEDDKTIAILDIHPVQPGHVLVIPKIQIDHIEDLPDDSYHAVWNTVKKVIHQQSLILKRVRVGISVVGTDVPHAHVHLIPFDNSQELRMDIDLNGKPDENALEQMATRLKFEDIKR